MKVIRHVNGPSAWILSSTDDPVCGGKLPVPVKTIGEPSRDDVISGMSSHRAENESLTGKQVTEVMVRQREDEAHGQGTYERRKVQVYNHVVSFYNSLNVVSNYW